MTVFGLKTCFIIFDLVALLEIKVLVCWLFKLVHRLLCPAFFLYKRSLTFLLNFYRSLTLPPPKEETLSRHSILGPNGLKGQWRPPSTDKRVCCFGFVCFNSIYSLIVLTFLSGVDVD